MALLNWIRFSNEEDWLSVVFFRHPYKKFWFASWYFILGIELEDWYNLIERLFGSSSWVCGCMFGGFLETIPSIHFLWLSEYRYLCFGWVKWTSQNIFHVSKTSGTIANFRYWSSISSFHHFKKYLIFQSVEMKFCVLGEQSTKFCSQSTRCKTQDQSYAP